MNKIASFCRIPDGSIPRNGLKSYSWIIIYKSKAKYDILTKVITYTGIILTLIIPNTWITYLAIESNIFSIIIFLNILIVSILTIPYLFSPLEYIITTKGILIKRVLKSFLIPYENIEKMYNVSWTWKRIRLFGSGGIYGFYGLFKIHNLGNVWMYVTDRKKTILIKLKDGNKYMISPDDPVKFINEISNIIRLQTK